MKRILGTDVPKWLAWLAAVAFIAVIVGAVWLIDSLGGGKRSQTPAAKAAQVASSDGRHAMSCSEWVASNGSKQLAFVRRTVGDTNLGLRRDALDSICFTGLRHHYALDPAEELRTLAQQAPKEVTVDVEALPPTLKPADPHQCFERMNVAGPGSWPHDCVAMGF